MINRVGGDGRSAAHAAAADARRTPNAVAARRTGHDHAGPVVPIPLRDPDAAADERPVCPRCGTLLDRDETCSTAHPTPADDARRTAMTRPDHPEDSFPGYHWEPHVDPDWRLTTGRRCRFTVGPGSKQCQKPSVAELNRASKYGPGKPLWWAYCGDPEHLHGRWVEAGAVWGWRLVADSLDGDPS